MFVSDRNDDPFAEIDKANANGQRNPYLLDGQYHLKIEKCSLIKARNKDLFYLVEFEILGSDNDERPIGMKVSWMSKMNTDMGPINCKRFLAAANGLDPNSEAANTEITQEIARLSVDASQPLAGTELYAQAVTTAQKNDPEKTFTNIRWEPVTDGADNAQVAQ